MRRFVFAMITAATLAAASVVPALAAGSPGSAFPEQPGSNVQTACSMVTTNPGTGSGGAAGLHESATAGAITTGLLTDACFGG